MTLTFLPRTLLILTLAVPLVGCDKKESKGAQTHADKSAASTRSVAAKSGDAGKKQSSKSKTPRTKRPTPATASTRTAGAQ